MIIYYDHCMTYMDPEHFLSRRPSHGQASTAVTFGPGSGTEAPGLPGAAPGMARHGAVYPVDASDCQG